MEAGVETKSWAKSAAEPRVESETKRRAARYIAAAAPEWLYPEKQLRSTHWPKLGDGLLFMPEPRDLVMGGEVMIGYRAGFEGPKREANSA